RVAGLFLEPQLRDPDLVGEPPHRKQRRAAFAEPHRRRIGSERKNRAITPQVGAEAPEIVPPHRAANRRQVVAREQRLTARLAHRARRAAIVRAATAGTLEAEEIRAERRAEAFVHGPAAYPNQTCVTACATAAP